LGGVSDDPRSHTPNQVSRRSMAFNQPNFTAVPNEFFDTLLRTLSPAEFAILMVITRKTVGWHQRQAAISRSDFESITGLSDKTVKHALDSLVEAGYVLVHRKVNGSTNHPSEYELHIDWGGGVKFTPGVESNLPQGWGNSDSSSLYKETIKQKNTPIVPNGDVTGTEGNDKTNPSNSVPEFVPGLPRAAKIIHENHPRRKCALRRVVELLQKILTVEKIPYEQQATYLKDLVLRHQRWCQSEDWTKENYQYTKGLQPWLNPKAGLYHDEPEVKQSPRTFL
jgi:phage replication O-like protein O